MLPVTSTACILGVCRKQKELSGFVEPLEPVVTFQRKNKQKPEGARLQEPEKETHKHN